MGRRHGAGGVTGVRAECVSRTCPNKAESYGDERLLYSCALPSRSVQPPPPRLLCADGMMDGWTDHLHWRFLGEHVLVFGLRLDSAWAFFVASCLTAAICFSERCVSFPLTLCGSLK